MKTDKVDKKEVKPGLEKSLKKYLGKNLSEKKTAALNENLEQIKAALRKHSHPQDH